MTNNSPECMLVWGNKWAEAQLPEVSEPGEELKGKRVGGYADPGAS